MRRVCAVAVGLLIVAWVCPTLAQTTQPAVQEEWLVEVSCHRTTGWVLRRYDFATGKRVVLREADPVICGHMSLIDARGRYLQLREAQGDHKYLDRRVELAFPSPGTPTRVFEELEVTTSWFGALSPDGRKIVVSELDGTLAIGDDTRLHLIPGKWYLTRLFSWSPDSSKVAFYHPLSDYHDDVHIQKHGVAVLTVDGELREVLKASEAVGTPNGETKNLGPGWGRSGRFVYYSDGLPPEDPRRQLRAWRGFGHPYPPAATYRVDLQTGRTERIGLGEFASVSPDETYIILEPVPRQKDDGSWALATAKVDLATKKVSYLPDAIKRPKISPSGKLVACPRGGGIICYRTSDWKRHRQPVIVQTEAKAKKGIFWGVCSETWGRDFRWIVVDKDAKPGSN